MKTARRSRRAKRASDAWSRVPTGTRLLLAALSAALLAAAAGIWTVGWWLDFSEPPVKSDLMVVLAGGFARPLHAADLYHKGYAPAIWLSRPLSSSGERLARKAGVHIPFEESVNREILIKRGVPAGRIHLYGNGVMSTAQEAAALARDADADGKKILVVTSRYHARRARWIFRSALPNADIRVTATPYERFTRKWWTDQSMARSAVLETAKTTYYLLGGRFINPLENTPHVH